MKAEELIIGHFDKILSQPQEAELQELLTTSPEARALYERHEAIETMMVSEAATLAPSEKLDEVAIGAALGMFGEIGGSSAGYWLSGKVVATIASVIVGGISLAVITTSGPDHTTKVTPKNESPAVSTMPAASAPSLIDTPTAITAPVVTEKPASTVESNTMEKVQAAGKPKANERATVKNSPHTKPPEIDLGRGGETVLKGTPQIKPKPQRNK